MITIDLTDRECSLILLAIGIAEDNAWANAADADSMLSEHAKKVAAELSTLKHWLGASMREKALEAAQ
jgi:hypothetical protein